MRAILYTCFIVESERLIFSVMQLLSWMMVVTYDPGEKTVSRLNVSFVPRDPTPLFSDSMTFSTTSWALDWFNVRFI